MKKMFAVAMTALFLICTPVFAGAQALFQTMTSAEEWPKVLASWQEAQAANDDVASANIIGAAAHRIAVSRQHPAAAMKVEDYIPAFFEANPALMPESGVVKLETFLTLARAGKLQHPPVPTAVTSVAMPVSDVASPTVSLEEVERRVKLALDKSIAADVATAKLEAEVEKLASRSTATDPAVLRRLVALEKKTADLTALQETVTGQTASTKALQSTVIGLQQTVATEIAETEELQETVTGQTVRLDTMQSTVDTLETASPKPDSFARLLTGGGIVLALLALIVGYLARGRAKEARRIADLAGKRLSDVQVVQEMHQEDIKRLNRRTADMKDIFIHESLIKHLEKLSGNRKHRSVVRVDDEEYILVFQLSADDKGMYRVFGIEGQHNAVSKKNMRSVILRAARDGRLNQKAGPAAALEEDDEDEGNVTPISAAVAVK